jgi:hypothetical protein
LIFGFLQIGFVCTKNGRFVEDFRPKPNLGDLLFTISDLLLRTDWVGFADFTLIPAITATERPMRGRKLGGIIPDFGRKVNKRRAKKNSPRRT